MSKKPLTNRPKRFVACFLMLVMMLTAGAVLPERVEATTAPAPNVITVWVLDELIVSDDSMNGGDSFHYNEQGLLYAYNSPSSVWHEYYSDGRYKQHFANHPYTYDENGRVATDNKRSITYNEQGFCAKTQYQYTSWGHDYDDVHLFSYDQEGRLIADTYTENGKFYREYRHNYDAYGNISFTIEDYRDDGFDDEYTVKNEYTDGRISKRTIISTSDRDDRIIEYKYRKIQIPDNRLEQVKAQQYFLINSHQLGQVGISSQIELEYIYKAPKTKQLDAIVCNNTPANIYNLKDETYSFKNYSAKDCPQQGCAHFGHCFGMAMTSAGYYLGLLDRTSLIGGDNSRSLYSFSATQKVKDAIHKYQNIQGTFSTAAIVAGGSYYLNDYDYYSCDIDSDWDEVINYVKNHNYDNRGLLTVGIVDAFFGTHAVNFLYYREVNGQQRIYIYNNEYPNEEHYLYKDNKGIIREFPDSTDTSIDCVALRDVPTYFNRVQYYDPSRVIYAIKDRLSSVLGAIVSTMDTAQNTDEYIMYELPDDVDNVSIVPNSSQATFIYMDKEYSFGDVKNAVSGVLYLDDENTSANDAKLVVTDSKGKKTTVYGKTPTKSDHDKQDASNKKGVDGTAIGKGASAEVADKAITSSKSDEGPKGSQFAPLSLKSSKQTKTSIKLSWKNVKGAKKYVIYGKACGKKNKMQKIATTTKKTYNVKKIGKKLKKGTYYNFMVVALDKNNTVISTSKAIHVATKGKKKIANPSKITVKSPPKKLKKGKTHKLAAKQVGLKGKAHRAIKYESSNTKVATVSSKGVIKAKKKGTCYIYVYAQNGLYRKVKVTVK